MFDITDKELQGIEAREERRRTGEPEQRAFTRIPGYGFGDDAPSDSGGPVPNAPALAPVVMPPGPTDGSMAGGAGKALALATVGMVVGAIAAGAWGAACGVTTMGALRNLARTKSLWNSANPADRSEAGKSATMGIFGLGIAGMIGYHAYTIRDDREKESFPW